MGVYENDILIQEFQSKEKTSHILPKIFATILKTYDIKNLYYTKGPGSFMAIKVSYLFLKTISIAKNIQLYASDGFAFNQNSPIKALGTLYFLKKNGKIQTQKLKSEKIVSFSLPKNLDKTLFSTNCEPLYIIPAL